MSAGLRTAATNVAIADKQLAGGEQLYRGVRFRRVQGITSDFSDLRLRGEKWTAILGDNLSAGTLTRTTKGASTLSLSVEDPRGKLMRNPLMEEAHQVELDELKWVLVKVSRQGRIAPLELTYEPLIVWKLRQIMGPHKAFRDKMTRAEFAQMLAFMVKPHPVFISPELHKIQPIAKAKQGKEVQVEAEVSRDEGIGEGAVNLTAKGVKATPAQINAADRALRVAASLNAPRKARVAMMLALIVESVLGSAASNWYEIEPASVSGYQGDNTDLEATTTAFLRGYNAGDSGAIATAENHPAMHAYEITQAVQRSGAGLPSNGAANYGPWTQEAEEWVEAGPQSSEGGGGSSTIRETKRYAYSQTKEESNWAAINRLAGEVHWDAFESAGWLYFLSEPALLKSHRRLNISDSTPWVIDTGFDYDVGKENAEMSVQALAKSWAAPPGSAVSVSKHGVADGDYIVSSIEAGLQRREGIVQITLRRPSEPLPEPAAKTSTRTIGGSGALGAAGAPQKVQEIIEFIDATDQAGTSYLWGGGHVSFASSTERMDCSGFVSAAVHAAGYLSTPLTSGNFDSVFPNGEGEWVTIYGDDGHVIMKVKYPDGTWRYAGTSGSNPGGGPGWIDDSLGHSEEVGKVASHPPGL